ncbi:MAG: hypothetical protein HYX56_04145 [Chloroflexi bacterium]|nr:hypothetical protein [Chloroflexota bacterium]
MRALLLVITFLGLAGCRAEIPVAGSPSAPAATGVTPGVTTSADPRAAPFRVTIAGRAYRIEAYVWRDFMPISPPDGKPMIASIKAIAEDGAPFPTTITADRVWVYGSATWESAPTEVRRSPEGGAPPSQIEVVARDGRKWDPGTKVDVTLRLVSGGASYLVRVTGVIIERTS